MLLINLHFVFLQQVIQSLVDILELNVHFLFK